MPKENVRAPLHRLLPPYESWHWPLPAFPELITVGRDSLRKVKDLKKHVHHGAYEICYVERGTVVWWVGREIHEVKGGEIFVTWPDEPHGGIDDVLHPCKSYWIELDFPAKRPTHWLGLPPAEGRIVYDSLKRLPRRRFFCPVSIARTWDGVFDAINMPSELTATSVRTAVVALLVETIRAGRKAANAAPISPEVRDAIRLMDQNMEYSLPLPELAGQVGWSTSHFKRRFRHEMGMAPAEFYLRRRLAAARQRIEVDGSSLAQVAMEFGFSSSQYLATSFHRVTGRTPSSFRTVAMKR